MKRRSRRNLLPTLLMLLALPACGQVGAAAPIGTVSPQPQTVATVAADPPRQSSVVASMSADGTISDQTGVLVNQLRARGLTVELVGEGSQPFLRPLATVLRVSGGTLAQPTRLLVHEYDDTAIAEADATRIQPDTSIKWTEPDGNVKTMHLIWVAPPHFFRQDRLLVMYMGTDPAILAVLTELLGPQFVGQADP